MAQKQDFSGLFGGPSEGDIRRLQGLEREKRIRQARADASGSGGGFIPSYIAGQVQRGQEGLTSAGQGIMGAAGVLREDPRLLKARKRDQDKGEILGIIGGFSDPNSPGGAEITPEEMKAGFGELMKRGYTEEAQKFLAKAQSMMGMALKERQVVAQETKAQAAMAKANNTNTEWNFGSTRVITDEAGDKFFVTQARPKDSKDPSTDSKTIYTAIGSHTKTKPEGETKVTNDQYGRSDEDKLAQALSKYQGQEEMKKDTMLYGSNLRKDEARYDARLKKETDKFKSDLNISEDEAKNFAKKNLNTSDEYMKAGMMAVSEKKKAQRLLELTKGLKTGGLAAVLASFKREFGVEAANEAEFRTGAQMLLVQNLKKIMGARPTDTDLLQLEKAMANIAQTPEANIAVLERFIAQMDKEVGYGRWFAENPEKDFKEFYSEQMSPPPPEDAIAFLKKNPKFRKQFESKYGKKAAKEALGGGTK